MKTTGFLVATAISAGPGALAQNVTWNIDPSHTNIKFNVSHMVISEVTGYFKKFEGKAVTQGDDFNKAQIEFTADVNSINTDDAQRDTHLKSDDFFNAEKFPQIIFRGKEFTKVDGQKYKLTGDLTIRDVTKPVEFEVTYGGMASAWGMTKAGFQIRGSISRFEYGLKWNALTEAGGLVVGETIKIECNVELVRQK